MKKENRPLLVIFITVFIYLLGFGMIIPLSPYLATQFGATPTQVGLLMAVYSFMQFLFAPFWGKISDRIGRRPILLFCLFFEGLSYVMFAFANNLWLLFLARTLAGIFSGSISTASAYISDVTPPNERSKGMGLLGAAFGLGFVFGPILGGVFGAWGQRISNVPPFGLSFSALWVSLFCFLTFVFAFKNLQESKQKNQESIKQKSRWDLYLIYLRRPVLGPLIWVYFLATFAMAHMESTLFLFVQDRFQWGLEKASFGFAYVGVMIVFTQGFLIRKILPKLGEKKVLLFGLISMAIGLAAIAGSYVVVVLAVVMTFVSVGSGFTNPALMGAISLLADKEEQGITLGVAQSMSSLARILGPAMGGFLYGNLGHTSPFLVSGAIALLAVLWVFRQYSKIPDSGRVTQPNK